MVSFVAIQYVENPHDFEPSRLADAALIDITPSGREQEEDAASNSTSFSSSAPGQEPVDDDETKGWATTCPLPYPEVHTSILDPLGTLDILYQTSVPFHDDPEQLDATTSLVAFPSVPYSK